MKTLVFSNSDNSLVLEFNTDLIGSNESLTVYQVTQIVSGTASIIRGTGGSADMNATLITKGFLDYAVVDEFNLGQFKTLATSANYKLVVRETGQDDVVLNTIV
jgi:shikimate 5-dehydrogenase